MFLVAWSNLVILSENEASVSCPRCADCATTAETSGSGPVGIVLAEHLPAFPRRHLVPSVRPGTLRKQTMNQLSRTRHLATRFHRRLAPTLALVLISRLTAAQEPSFDKAPVARASANVAPADAIPAYVGARASRPKLTLAQRYLEIPYMKRYAPENLQWEVGLFTGVLFPSGDHNLKVQVLPRDEYSSVAGELGGRLAFYPWAFVGAEVEAWAGGASTESTGYSAILYAIRGHVIAQLPLYSVVPFALFGVGTLGASSETMGHDRDPAFHFGAGVKVPFNHRVSGRLDLRDVMTQKGNGAEGGKQTHHPELQLGVTFTFERTQPPTPRDRDYDGLYDQEDACPDVGALTLDGCPLDTDDDGILDVDDHCPQEFGPAPSGCPVLDADADGIVIPVDKCPTEPGVSPDGCPQMDPDGDGIGGDLDRCPQEAEVRNGFEDEDGCPDQVPGAVARLSGVVPGLRFKRGSAEIVEGSGTALQNAASVLLEYPSVRIELSASTSSEGGASADSHLSQERAESVRRYLMGYRVPGDRIVVRATGPTEPADADSNATREQDHTIEITVLY